MSGCINKTIHLDGSVCKERKSKPKKSEIAKYWKEKILNFGIFIDWGEPSCWACGYLDRSYDINDLSLPLDEVFKVWNKQYYLQRCHVIPEALGGCSCCGNLVLLCKECHRENPDTNNVELFLRWMQNRRSYGNSRYEQLKIVFKEFGLCLNNLNFFLFTSEYFLNYFRNNSIHVGGRYTDASRVACLIDFKSQYSTSQLIEFIPDYAKEFVVNEIEM